MKYRQYRFKFYLNASHAILIGGNLGERHPHTWEICVNTIQLGEGFVQFQNVEKEVETWLAQYENRFLNETEPFNTMNPTLENCCFYFKDEIQRILNAQGWELLTIEMSETPTRSFVINLLDEEDSVSVNKAESLADMYINEMLKGTGENEGRP